MTPDDVIDVLTKCAAFDQRTIGETDVMAWHEVIGRYDRADALAAVTRHYTESSQRAMPADILRHARAVRDERRRLEAKTAPRALPSRFEDDIERDSRVREGVQQCRDILTAIVERARPSQEAS